MFETFHRIDEQTMALVQQFAQQYSCSTEVALKFLLKTGRCPQQANEDNETYAARLEQLPDSSIATYRAFEAANDS